MLPGIKIRYKGLLLLLLLAPALSWSQKKQAIIRISQEESMLLEAYESSMVLQKKSFKIQVFLENVTGIYVFAAFTDSICCRLSELDSITGFRDMPGRAIKEQEYNKDKELLVNDDNSCAYWYYDKETSWRGFNKKVVFLDSGQVIAVKTVKQVFHLPTQREIKLKDINQPLYLFFVAVSEFDNEGRPLKELTRKKVKIEWREED